MNSNIGVQSYTYQNSTFAEFCDELDAIDLAAAELYSGHLGPESTPEERRRARERLQEVDVDSSGIGVYSIDGQTEVDDIFALADDMDCEYVSVGLASANAGLVEPVIDRAQAYDVPVAVHNTPAGTFATIEDVESLLATYDDDLFGVCLDTGNFVDAGDDVGSAVSAFADRIHAVHLKGFFDDDANPVPEMDLVEFLTDLADRTSFDRTPMIEYEINPVAPGPAVQAYLDTVNSTGGE
jgi:sugar phosphate isomerase/epimerase